MKKLGLIINPIAGMGGKVGLKGSDGKEVIEQARELGAKPESGGKALKALKKLEPLKDDLMVYVANGPMGEDVIKETSLNYEVAYNAGEETDPEDTEKLAKQFLEQGVDLILFAGGDGTARNIAAAVGLDIPVLGIPAGVKIHSPVYGRSPESAGEMAYLYLSGDEIQVQEEEVIDIEEEAFRRDEIITEIYGYLNVPYDTSHMQNLKSITPQSDTEAQLSAALQVLDDMKDGYYYIIGSGSTNGRILEELDLPVTMLGVDIIKDKKLVAKDVNESEIIDIIKGQPTKLVVTPMGGQGYIFGRGNQQLSANVLRELDKKDIIIIASPGKMDGLGSNPLLIYTGDEEIDEEFSGYYSVITGYGQHRMQKAVRA